MKIKKLIIGTKFEGHDSAIFVIIPQKREIFGISTERVTRYKHDFLPLIPALKRFIEYYKVDTSYLEEVIISHSFSKDNQIKGLYNYEFIQAKRDFFDVKYIKDYKINIKKFKSNPLKYMPKLLFTSKGLDVVKYALLNKKNDIKDVIKIKFQSFFPNAKIKVETYDHQLTHAISAYYFSPFDEALIFTQDGYGDESFGKVFITKDSKLQEIGDCKITNRDEQGSHWHSFSIGHFVKRINYV